jgi:beta-galactosidase
VLDGRPAIVRNTLGAGAAWYLSAALDDAGLEEILASALDAAALPVRATPNRDIEVVTRGDGSTDYTFVLNHGTAPATVAAPEGAHDLLTGDDITGKLTLPAWGVAVLAHPATASAGLLTVTTTDTTGN